MRLKRAFRSMVFDKVAQSGWPLGSVDELDYLKPEQLEQVRRFFNRDKFFLFGHPRSGTTLLGRLITLHPEVHCNWNARFFNWDGLLARVATPSFKQWFESQGNRWVYGKGLETSVVRVMCDFLMEQEAEGTNAAIVGDKTPNLEGAKIVDWMDRLYPDARLVMIVRDGRDAILSMRVRAFIDYPETLTRADLSLRDRIRRDNKPYLHGERSVFTQPWLEAHAAAWEKNVRECHQLASKQMADRYRAVRFEDLVKDTTDVMFDVWRFLGVQSDSSEAEDAVRMEIARNPKAAWHDEADPDLVRGFQRGVQEGWRQVYTRDDLDRFNQIAGDTLDAWGYDTSE